MKKKLKIAGIIIVLAWLTVATYLSVIFIKKIYHDILIEEATMLMPFFISDEPLSIKKGELQLDAYFAETPFLDRIEDAREGYLLTAIQYSEGDFDLKLPSKSSGALHEKFKVLYDNWPVQLKSFCENNIYKVLIVGDLGSSGRALSLEMEGVFVILIDEKILTKPPNDWATENELFTFSKHEDIDKELRVIIEEESDPILTFENLLIHEIGHAFGVKNKFTPNFDRVRPVSSQYPFFSETYRDYRMNFILKNREDILYGKITYDGNSQLDIDDYIELLEGLEKTSFPTIYSSRSELELFAEVFYSYIHCSIQKKPFRYEIYESGEIQKFYTNGINSKRCEFERSFIENYFNN